MDSLKNLEKILGRLGDLPAMPEVAAEVMRLTEDPNTTVSDVCTVIENDPALAAKVLKVSNSPYYGMRQVVGTLKLALVILGVREVRNIVLGISVLDRFHDDMTEFLVMKNGLWAHSVLVAAIAKKLGRHLDISLQGEDFVAGLLHDIGKFVMWTQMGQEYHDLFRRHLETGESLSKLEYEKYEFDHADAAAALGTAWRFPPTLCDAMRYHHPRKDRPLRDAADPKLAALIRISDMTAREDWTQKFEGAPIACTDTESWEVLQEGLIEMEARDRQQVLSGFVAELSETPPLILR